MTSKVIIVRLMALFFLFFSFFFNGCATMKKAECLNADWHSIGYEDGTKGYKTFRIAKHRKACAKYGITPDLQLYQRGHSQGLIEYCTPHQGYRLGLGGKFYNDVCQGELREAFLTGYNSGRDIYLFEKKIKDKQKNLNRIKDKINRIDDELKTKDANLKDDCIDPEKCKQAVDAIRNLERERRELNSKLKSIRHMIKAMKQTLTEMKAQSRI